MAEDKHTQGGIMYIRLKPYLEELAIKEEARPEEERRPVPTMEEIARSVKYNPVSMSRLVTGRIKSLNLELGAAIVDELRRRGFPMQVTDLVGYEPPEPRAE
jgi:hypothetical protein